MPQPLGDDLRVLAPLEREGRIRVPQIVQPQPREARLRRPLLERLTELVRMERPGGAWPA